MNDRRYHLLGDATFGLAALGFFIELVLWARS